MTQHLYAIQYRKFGRWNTYSKRFTERDAALKAFVRIARSGQFEKVLLKVASLEGETPSEWSILCDEQVLRGGTTRPPEAGQRDPSSGEEQGFFGALGDAVAEAEEEQGGALIVDETERIERLALLAAVLVVLGFGLGLPLLLLYGAAAAVTAAFCYARQRGDRLLTPHIIRINGWFSAIPFRVRQGVVVCAALAALVAAMLRSTGEDPFLNAAIDVPGSAPGLNLTVPQLVTCIERYDLNGVRYRGQVRIERDGLYRAIIAEHPKAGRRFNFRLREGRAVLESVELAGRREISTPERQGALLHVLTPCLQAMR